MLVLLEITGIDVDLTGDYRNWRWSYWGLKKLTLVQMEITSISSGIKNYLPKKEWNTMPALYHNGIKSNIH
ncbi:hypothetical protein Avbf_10615 [Armadillidium vulgare]|nr:hypothetical protein Avbf_10615 [Armadillidium vulgare]